MAVTIITIDELQQFKADILREISIILKSQHQLPTNKWLKSAEVKKLLKVSTGTLQNLRRNGTLPHTRIGGTLYYDYATIRKMLVT